MCQYYNVDVIKRNYENLLMLEFKFVLLLLAATSYPKITLKEDTNSAIPIQGSESQAAQMKSLDTNTQWNISEGFISKLKEIKNSCVSNTIFRFKEVFHLTQNQVHRTYETVDKDIVNFQKTECKAHCVYDQWYRVKCVPMISVF